MLKDCRGHQLTGATEKSLPHYETAVRELNLFINDPVASVDKAIAESPEFVMAHALRAWLHLLGTEPAGLAVARASRDAAWTLPATAQEQGHLDAIDHLIDGRWHAAAQVLEDVAIEHPHDLLALQVGHQLDFFRGEARMLRDRIARALPAWSHGRAGLSHHARHARLRPRGDRRLRRRRESRPHRGRARSARWLGAARRRACDGDAGPPAGRHRLDGAATPTAGRATTSSPSTTGGTSRSITSISARSTRCCSCSTGRSTARSRAIILEMIDASAMLWRLHLRGVDVGDRWQAVADAWEPHAGAGNYAFNDAHAAMAFVGAGRQQSLARVIEAQQEAMARDGDNAVFTREVGHPVVLAIKAFGDGNYAETVWRLRDVRNIAQPLRRQPRATRRHRPHADRGGAALRPAGDRRPRSPPNGWRCGRRARSRGCSSSVRQS